MTFLTSPFLFVPILLQVKIWFQNRRARERRERDGSPSVGGGVGGGGSTAAAVCPSSSAPTSVVDFKSRDFDVKPLSRHAVVIPSLHAVMRAKGTANYLTLAEQFDLRPYYAAPGPGSAPRSAASSVALFENRMTSYASSSWPPSSSSARISVPTAAAADIFAHLSSVSQRYSSAFGPINFLR